MRTIYILSASDRFNYGDILFPIIAKNQLEGMNRLVNTALISTDHSRIGGLPTKNYRHLYSDKSRQTHKSALLVAGGEVLGAGWAQLYGYCNRYINRIYNLFASRRITLLFLEYLIRATIGCKEPMPFVPVRSEFIDRMDIYFHAVGGVNIHQSPFRSQIQHTFAKAVYLSARELATYQSIHEGLNCPSVELTPDSGVLMSEYFDKKPSPFSEYICFQIRNGKYDDNDYKVLKTELEHLSSKFNKRVVLLPIGNCPGHEDYLPLQQLRGILACPCKLIRPLHIETIMMTIANADLFIGTSLHGIVTAMSFEVPYVAIDPSIRKIDCYLQTWGPEGIREAVPFNRISSAGEIAIMLDKSLLTENIKIQKSKVIESFSHIKKLLTSDC